MAAEEASSRASGALRALRSRIANATEQGGAAARKHIPPDRGCNGIEQMISIMQASDGAWYEWRFARQPPRNRMDRRQVVLIPARKKATAIVALYRKLSGTTFWML